MEESLLRQQFSLYFTNEQDNFQFLGNSQLLQQIKMENVYQSIRIKFLKDSQISKEVLMELNDWIKYFTNLSQMTIKIDSSCHSHSLSFFSQISKAFINLRNLEFKIMSYQQNYLKDISDIIKDLSSIISLKIDFYSLEMDSNRDVEYFLTCLSSLKNLETLKIVTLKLKCIDDLSKYRQMGDAIGKLVNLKTFELSINQQSNFYNLGVINLGLNLQKLINLKSLSIAIFSNNLVTSSGYDVLANGLSKLTQLASLNITIGINNKVTESSIFSLFGVISNLKELSELTVQLLDCILIEDDKKINLNPYIINLINLKKLKITLQIKSILSFDDSRAIIFGEELSQLIKLQELSYAKNCKEIAIGLSPLSNLTRLSLKFKNNQYIDLDTMLKFSLSFKNLVNLKYLDFSFSKIDIEDDQFIILSQGIQSLKYLETLNLYLDRVNQMKDEGYKSIGSIFKNLQYLKQLQISFTECQLDDIGIENIHQGLVSLQNLQELIIEITNNEKLTFRGIQLCCEAIQYLPNLSKLLLEFSLLNYNYFSLEQDLSRLVKPISLNNCIKYIYFIYNNERNLSYLMRKMRRLVYYV